MEADHGQVAGVEVIGMANIEKVIKGLEIIIWEVDHNSMWLPGDDDIRDAIELLKEHRQIVRCKDCKFGEACKNGRGEHGVWCYNTQSANKDWVHEPDWYCADGERRNADEP